jgi:hypothetical protein
MNIFIHYLAYCRFLYKQEFNWHFCDEIGFLKEKKQQQQQYNSIYVKRATLKMKMYTRIEAKRRFPREETKLILFVSLLFR